MNPQNIDVLDQLRQLGALRDEHVLTHEEYEVKKTELRAQLSTS